MKKESLITCLILALEGCVSTGYPAPPPRIELSTPEANQDLYEQHKLSLEEGGFLQEDHYVSKAYPMRDGIHPDLSETIKQYSRPRSLYFKHKDWELASLPFALASGMSLGYVLGDTINGEIKQDTLIGGLGFSALTMGVAVLLSYLGLDARDRIGDAYNYELRNDLNLNSNLTE